MFRTVVDLTILVGRVVCVVLSTVVVILTVVIGCRSVGRTCCSGWSSVSVSDLLRWNLVCALLSSLGWRMIIEVGFVRCMVILVLFPMWPQNIWSPGLVLSVSISRQCCVVVVCD